MVATAAQSESPTIKVEIAKGITIDVPRAPWSSRDRAAWYWPDVYQPAEWAERFRYLERAAIPGPWQNTNAPYLRGIMNLCAKRGIAQLAIMKGAQLGVSEAMRNVMGARGSQDPRPAGLALPSKEKGREIVENDVLPFFKSTFSRHRQLRPLLSPKAHDMKKGQIKLANGFILYLMWAGSPTSLASNPMGWALCDEVDKFVPWTGNDADPVTLIKKRLRTYPDAFLVLVSTPTYNTNFIATAFNESSIKLYFLVPCPHCGIRQRLLFGDASSTFGIKWSEYVRELQKKGERLKAADAVMQIPGACWYECAKCHGKITEVEKRRAVRAGVWGTVGDDGVIGDGAIADAEALPEFPPGSHVGMQIGAQYCMWESCTMAHIAAEFLRASSMPARYGFRTSTLGEPWQEIAQDTKTISVSDRQAVAVMAEAILPKWTARLIAAVDTQKDHFWVVIRAWGPGMRSQRVWHGKVFSFGEIEQWTFRTPFKNEDGRLPARTCDLVVIDSGGTKQHTLEAQASQAPLPSRVMDVYRWALANQAKVRAIKGDSHPTAGTYIRRGRGEFVADRQKATVPIWLLDTHHFHDELADLMHREDMVIDFATGEVQGKAPIWLLNNRVDEEYTAHLGNMHKVAEGKGAAMKWVWRPLREGVRVDYRACEAYQVAAAYLAGVHILPDLGAYIQHIESEIAERARSVQAQPKPKFSTPGGQTFLASQR
jgi:phage terminase large subunit GpA-like protein